MDAHGFSTMTLKVVPVLTVAEGSAISAISVTKYVIEVEPDKVVSVACPMLN